MVELHGSCEGAFAPVRAAFLRCFADLGETGAAMAVSLDGRLVVDLWAGTAAPATAWQRDTLVHAYSVTKPFAAASLLLLIERGLVELDAPVVRYWPEFGQAGKERVTVRQLLCHQAGVLVLREPQPREAIFDWDRVCRLLAAEAPWWEPGTAVGEHAYFYGHLAGEVVRRVDGRSLGAFFREEIAAPWGLDFHIGLTAAEEARCAEVEGIDAGWRQANAPPGSIKALALDNPPAALYGEVVNSSAWRRAQVPAVNGHGTARAIARFYAGIAAGGTLDGVRLFSPALVAEATTTQAEGRDVLLNRNVRWGLGFQLDTDGFGMGGLGGVLGWANPEHRFAFAYVTRRMLNHDRAMAVYEAAARVAGFEPVTD